MSSRCMSQAYSKLVTPLQQSQRDPPATDPGHHGLQSAHQMVLAQWQKQNGD